MTNRLPTVLDPAKKPEENIAAGIFRLCEAVEAMTTKVTMLTNELGTIKHAINAAADKKK